VSNSHEKWTFVKQYECSKGETQRLIVPGEHVAKFLRVRCVKNIRGGDIVTVRHVVVKGLVR